MRPIDAVSLSEGIELHRQSTDQEYEMDRQWAVGYNAGLDRALYSIAYAKTIAPPPNDPLTLEELRKMDGEPVWVIPIGNVVKAEYALVNVENEWLCASDTDFWEFDVYGVGILAYRRKPEENT